MIELPTYIWKLIFQYVDSDDVYNMTVTSSSLYAQLRTNEIWSDIVNRNWIDMLCDYDLEEGWEIRNSDQLSISYFEMFRNFRYTQYQLEQFLVVYNPTKLAAEKGSFEQAVELFGTEPLKIPVIYNLLVHFRQLLLYQNFQRTSAKVALLENLLVVQNRRLFYSYYYDCHKGDQQQMHDPADPEFTMFKISLLDKSFHHLVGERRKYFERCQKYFEQVRIDIFTGVYSGVRWSQLKTKTSKSDLSLDFKNTMSYFAFVSELLNNVLNKLISPHIILNNQQPYGIIRFAPEDNYVLRFYNGLSFGTQDLVFSVAGKMMRAFFKTPVRIYPNHTTAEPIPIRYFSQGLQIGFSHIFLFRGLGLGVRINKEMILFSDLMQMDANERSAIFSDAQYSPLLYIKNHYETTSISHGIFENITSLSNYHKDMLRSRESQQKIFISPPIDMLESERTNYTNIFLPWHGIDEKPLKIKIDVESINQYLDYRSLRCMVESSRDQNLQFKLNSCYGMPDNSTQFHTVMSSHWPSYLHTYTDASFSQGAFVKHNKFGDFGVVIDHSGESSSLQYQVYGENNNVWTVRYNSISRVTMDNVGLKSLQVFLNTADVGVMGTVLFDKHFDPPSGFNT